MQRETRETARQDRHGLTHKHPRQLLARTFVSAGAKRHMGRSVRARVPQRFIGLDHVEHDRMAGLKRVALNFCILLRDTRQCQRGEVE